MRRRRDDGGRPVHHWSRRDELAAVRQDLGFVLGVIGDVLRGRSFTA